MSIRRAMPMIRSADLASTRAFWEDLIGFEPAMEEPGFLMLRSPSTPTTQIIVTSREVADAEVADVEVRAVDISLEVADVDQVYRDAVDRGLEIVKPIADEAWGMRRFFVRDPDGLIVNVASHSSR